MFFCVKTWQIIVEICNILRQKWYLDYTLVCVETCRYQGIDRVVEMRTNKEIHRVVEMCRNEGKVHKQDSPLCFLSFINVSLRCTWLAFQIRCQPHNARNQPMYCTVLMRTIAKRQLVCDVMCSGIANIFIEIVSLNQPAFLFLWTMTAFHI